MNKRIFILLLLSMACSSCTTLSSVERNYGRITFQDGIDKEEAKVIAQMEYLKSGSNDSYKTGSAKVYDSDDVLSIKTDKVSFVTHDKIYEENLKRLKYNNSWYVSFKPKFLSLFSNYYLVVLDKITGEPQYSYDSNALASIGKLFVDYMKPTLFGVSAIGKYYKENNQFPDSAEELRRFWVSREDTSNKEIIDYLERLEIQKINDNKLRVKYIPDQEDGFYTAMSSLKSDMDQGTDYEMEIKDGEVFITNGNMNFKMDHSDESMTINTKGKVEVDSDNVQEILEEILE